MKRKFIACLIALIVAVSCVFASGAPESADVSVSTEPDHIIVTWLYLGNVAPDLELVQEEVNKVTVPEINVEIEFKPVGAYDAFVLFPTWIATGERIDLMMPLLQDLKNNYINVGGLNPIDEFLDENGKYLLQLDSEGQPILSANRIDGETWAVLMVPSLNGQGGGFKVTKDYIAEIWLDVDEKKVYSYDELTEIFSAIKERHPDMYPCGIVTSGISNSQYAYAAAGLYDPLSGCASYTGVIMGNDDYKVENLFTTEEYKTYLEYVRQWYLAGYIHPDASITDQTNDGLKAAGVSAGYFIVSSPIQRGDNDYMLRTCEPYTVATGIGGWVIPITAQEPKAAVRFLDLVWKDEDLANLIQWGIEGKHYVIKDESIGYIGFPEGVDASTSGYYNTFGLWGDSRKIYSWSPNDLQSQNAEYSEEALKHQTVANGLQFNPAPVENEIAAVAAVCAQYLPSLESGSADLDVYYPQFIEALKKAGIDKIIAEKQSQVDKQIGK